MKPRATRNSQCKICCLPADQQAILERLHCSGASDQSLADRFGMSRWAVRRHCEGGHLSNCRRAELMAGPVKVGDLVNRAADESRTVLEMYQVTRSLLFSRMLACAEAGDNNGTATVGRVLAEVLDKLSRLTGELRQLSGLTINSTTVNNFIGSSEFNQLIAVTIDALKDFPEARANVVRAIREISDAPAAPGPNGSRYAAEPVTFEGEAIQEMMAVADVE